MRTIAPALHFSLLLVVAFLSVTNAEARSLTGLSYTVEPIVGYERAYKVVPSPHTSLRLLYGVRVLAGIPLASGELEATRAADSETYPAQLRTVEETSDKLKLGLRTSTSHALGTAFFRAGGQAQRVERIDTIAVLATQTTEPWDIHPYAGAGLELGTGSIRLSAAATVIFRDMKNWGANDIETTGRTAGRDLVLAPTSMSIF